MANVPIGSLWPEKRERLLAATIALMQNNGGVAESRMRAGASWTDRTGMAREGLFAEVTVDFGGSGTALGGFGVVGDDSGLIGAADVTKITLSLNHTQEYGKWLETVLGAAHGRRAYLNDNELSWAEWVGPYAIIHPTADAIGPSIQRRVRALWSRAL